MTEEDERGRKIIEEKKKKDEEATRENIPGYDPKWRGMTPDEIANLISEREKKKKEKE